MKLKFFFFLLYAGLLQFPAGALGQMSAPSFSNGDTSFATYMTAHSGLDDLLLCNRSLVLMRFKIDPSGRVTNIAFSRETDPRIKRSLQGALESTNGKWQPVKKKSVPVLSGYLILPCFIAIENGCSQAVIDDYFKSRDSLRPGQRAGDRRLDSLRSAALSRSNTSRSLDSYFSSKAFESMMESLTFDDQDPHYPMNCRILPQINVIVIK